VIFSTFRPILDPKGTFFHPPADSPCQGGTFGVHIVGVYMVFIELSLISLMTDLPENSNFDLKSKYGRNGPNYRCIGEKIHQCF